MALETRGSSHTSTENPRHFRVCVVCHVEHTRRGWYCSRACAARAWRRRRRGLPEDAPGVVGRPRQARTHEDERVLVQAQRALDELLVKAHSAGEGVLELLELKRRVGDVTVERSERLALARAITGRLGRVDSAVMIDLARRR